MGESKSPRIGALVDGSPIVILDKGKPREEVMKLMRLRDLDIEIAARNAQVPSTDQIDYAVLERNGIDQHHSQKGLMLIENWLGLESMLLPTPVRHEVLPASGELLLLRSIHEH